MSSPEAADRRSAASGTLAQKPTFGDSHTARYMPSMYSEPWAKLTMRRDAEDQRQPGGDQEQRARAREPVQELQQDGGAAHCRVYSLRSARISWSEGWNLAPSA